MSRAGLRVSPPLALQALDAHKKASEIKISQILDTAGLRTALATCIATTAALQFRLAWQQHLIVLLV